MKHFPRIICGVCLALATCANTPAKTSYLDRFVQYLHFSKTLPDETPEPDFIAFIEKDTPLSNKLREKWLYKLAEHKQWKTYLTYYKSSDSISLQCYQAYAYLQNGQQDKALHQSKPIWLTADELPKACNPLFEQLIANHLIDNQLILGRFELALDKRHFALAKHLLGLAKLEDAHEKRLLEIIHKQPLRIVDLSQSPLHAHYYLYGLKRLVSSNPKKAVELWKKPESKKMLNADQKQAFLAHLALYKAIRDKADTKQWFAQVDPTHYNETLLDWQIRYALRHQDWLQVEALIMQSQKKDEPGWQYWLARAKEATGRHDTAMAIYQTLAQKRHYYGFLASTRLKQPFALEQEPNEESSKILKQYASIIEQIKTLYQEKHYLEASRMANDFSSELPKDEKSAFVTWLHEALQWTGKSVYLSSDDMLANQISLRFPLAHQKIITKYAATYDIPKPLVFAIIRQESAFRQEVISPVGAHGLMQLMPSTAKQVARLKHIDYRNTTQLFIPDKNIELGVAYLNHLKTQFDGNPILMVAAYNAGPRQVSRWIKKYPLTDNTAVDIWIETLPWGETRNYVKSVMAFYAVYLHRLDKKANFTAFLKQNINHNNQHKDSLSATKPQQQTEKNAPI